MSSVWQCDKLVLVGSKWWKEVSLSLLFWRLNERKWKRFLIINHLLNWRAFVSLCSVFTSLESGSGWSSKKSPQFDCLIITNKFKTNLVLAETQTHTHTQRSL